MTPRMLGASLLVVVALVLPVAARAADPSQVIDQRCAKCHGKSGHGDGQGLKDLDVGVAPVDWTDKSAMAKWSDGDLAKIIDQGGKALGKSKVMPAYHGKLSPEEIAQLVAYIRSLGK